MKKPKEKSGSDATNTASTLKVILSKRGHEAKRCFFVFFSNGGGGGGVALDGAAALLLLLLSSSSAGKEARSRPPLPLPP